MKKYEIHLADWQRILFGQAPPVFLIEVFIRTLIIYIFLLLILRWLGKRMSGQLTILEMSVMLTLGAIVAVAMQTPDRGLTLSIFVLFGTLVFQRGLSWLGVKSARIEELSQGRISTLLKDGVLDLDEMRTCRISREQLFSQLRNSGIFNLGEVRRVYLEACGIFTTIKMHSPVPGLATLPADDGEALSLLPQATGTACTNCGNVRQERSFEGQCSRCGADKDNWTRAVTK